MHYNVTLSLDEFQQIKSFTLFLSKIIYNVDQVKQEEELIKRFTQKLDNVLREEKADLYSLEEIKKMPKLKDGHHRITKDGLHQIRYRKDGYNKQFTSKSLKVVKAQFKEWVQSVNEERTLEIPKKPD